MHFDESLKLHIIKHPLLKPQDIIKFCFQAAYGAEHILKDKDAAREYFFNEFNSTDESDISLYEELNESYCRVNLAAWKKEGLDPEDLFRIFAESSESGHCTDTEIINIYFNFASKVIYSIDSTIIISEWEETLDRYISEGIHPVHHSDIYRQNYKPAYRVVRTDLIGR